MTYPSLAIIGTAGRKEDKTKLTHLHYDRMLKASTALITQLGIDPRELKLFSGGAAWADHLVVSLAILSGLYTNTTLFLPAQLGPKGYIGDNERTAKTADTANYYHREFSKVTGKDSIAELHYLQQHGATLIAGNGSFHARNSDVAKAVSPDGLLLACTFGSPDSNQPPWTIRPFSNEISADVAGLKDGGTADTWDKCRSKIKYHLKIGVDA